MTNMIDMGEYKLFLIWRSAKSKKFYGTLKVLLTQDHMGLEILNTTPTFFIRCQSNVVRTLATMVEYRAEAVAFLGNRPIYNNFCSTLKF